MHAHLGSDCMINVNKRGSNNIKIFLFGNDSVKTRGSVGEMWRRKLYIIDRFTAVPGESGAP